jgi:hypothetical protein
MDLTDLYVVEWSATQDTFRVCTVGNMLEANLECYLHERDPSECDWIVVGLSTTHAGADRYIADLRRALDGRGPGPT